MQDILAIFALPAVQYLLGGVSGGIARAIVLKVKLYDFITTAVLGMLLGLFVAPQVEPNVAALLSKFTVDPDRLPGFTAFAIGVGGVAITGFVIDGWNDWRKSRQPRGAEPVDPVPPKDGG